MDENQHKLEKFSENQGLLETQSVENKYKKLDLHKHILKRPNMYIGSTKRETVQLWIFNEKRGENEPLFVLKEITYVPGLYKIFDEILINARDHCIRTRDENLELCTIIKVNLDRETGRISVWNNGSGIEVVVHKKYKLYIPTLIFGELLSSSNYNDKARRKVGGTNGLGAKLTNIYSIEFEVETLDAERNRKFYQKFSNNMYTVDDPIIVSGKGKKPYTKVSFIPDYKRFDLDGLTDDIIALFKKRVYDVAMNSGAKVYYNDELVPVNSFTKYVDLYFPEGSEHVKLFDTSSENWKVCVVYDPTDKIEHQVISFVNGICTSRGGTHCDHVVNQIVQGIRSHVARKSKNLVVKPNMIRENLIFFIDSIIINPEFDTQTKECLKSKVSEFGSNYNISESFLKKIVKTGVVEQIIANAQARLEASLGKKGAKRGIVRYEKLYDAHRANLRQGDCTLILTEGDSAKTFALSGLNVIGRDYYGVFPLRGKLLNVRDESPIKIANNEEIKAIIQIIGLEHGKVYNDLKGLRYGNILALADQDVDGLHIKGLIMNFIHYFWPSLIKHEGFIRSIATPLIKATKNKKVISFTTMQAFEEWKKKNSKGWTIKYYKGLGTHSPAEAQECFDCIDDKLVFYYWKEKLDESCENNNNLEVDDKLNVYKPKYKDVSEDALTLAFAKKREDDRKLWLSTYRPNQYIDQSERRVSYYDFIHKELINYSVYDTIRSIPNIMDGFKPSQRKVYYGSVKKNIYHNEIKVAQLSGYISEHTHYLHGEQSLQDTIIKMAQNFVGSNNINLLIPNGQFGSRLCGGKDAASPRYIFTQLNPLGKKIFIEDDFEILNHQIEEGERIEPFFYVPILPMVLVNGAEGIGTGYSCNIEPCNPRDICYNIKRILEKKSPKKMTPWFRHFTGTVIKIGKNRFLTRANYEIKNDNIHITDLPIGIWTDHYKSFLDNLLEQGATQKAQNRKAKKEASRKNRGGSKRNNFLDKRSRNSHTAKVAKKNTIGMDIRTYREDCTEIRVNFVISFHPGKLNKYVKNGLLEKNLKLAMPLSLTNMHLFDENGRIQKYHSYSEILVKYAQVRLEFYQKRKDFLLDRWKKEVEVLRWKLKFVEYVITGKIVVFKNGISRKMADIISRLEELQFPKFAIDNKEPSYDYLTSMTILKFSQEEVEKLRKMVGDKIEQIGILNEKTPEQLWEEELDEFMEAYDKWEMDQEKNYRELMVRKGSQKRKYKL
ncbi:MAG: DNA gyrase subunit A [Thermoplasmata archaeon]